MNRVTASLGRKNMNIAGLVLQRLTGLACSLLLSGSLMQAGTMAQAADSSDKSLSKLEAKFFQHDYPKDTTEARIERLEKMVFGEAKTGSSTQRLENLLSAVPNLNDVAAEPATGDAQAAQPASTAKAAPAPTEDSQLHPTDSSKYPAVTAIETKYFGRDYAAEPIGKRLDRLELKVLGRTSNSHDLVERMDNLKAQSGIDVAKQAPDGSDWADEDEMDYIPGSPPARQSQPQVSSGEGEDGKSFSGRDLRQDMQRAFGNRGQNSYGSGSYGMDPPPPSPVPRNATAGGYRKPAPNTVTPGQALALGLNQQVQALESEIFGRSYSRDALPARLNRLESTVFPNEKPATDKALPERVNRLLSVIPLSSSGRIAQGSRSRGSDEDMDDFDMMSSGIGAQPRASSGLSKIINSMSNLLGGGFTGSYPMTTPGLMPDPQTGLLYDRMTGNLVDPNTGVVVGQRMMPNMGTPMNSFGSFNNGFAPYGSAPYGYGSGSGIRFGFGSIGRYGGGVWP